MLLTLASGGTIFSAGEWVFFGGGNNSKGVYQ